MPPCGALKATSIFIASITPRMSLAATCWSARTRTSSTVPGTEKAPRCRWGRSCRRWPGRVVRGNAAARGRRPPPQGAVAARRPTPGHWSRWRLRHRTPAGKTRGAPAAAGGPGNPSGTTLAGRPGPTQPPGHGSPARRSWRAPPAWLRTTPMRRARGPPARPLLRLSGHPAGRLAENTLGLTSRKPVTHRPERATWAVGPGCAAP